MPCDGSDRADLRLRTDEDGNDEVRLGGAHRAFERDLVARMHDSRRDRLEARRRIDELLVAVVAA